jgi:hypothetical protein
MGGFFAPDPPSSPAPVVVAPTTDPEAEAAAERLEAINRNRRGMAGTIATSETGVLQSSTGRPAKTLLGD